MNNYQLYSTNVLLGGQIKWDIILESDGELFVKNFHITPINDNIPYNKYTEDYLLNYPHQENLKSYYKEIEGYFYDTYISPELKHNWPIITEKDKSTIKVYDDTYMMGCKRSKDFQLYGKQFEFLCPVWIEKLDTNLKFTININTTEGKQVASKTFKLSKNGKNFHDNFVSYFNNYIKYVGLDEGSDDVLNINLSKKIADLSGIDVSNGNVVHRDISNVVDNILTRERPLMEFDYMIINNFPRTKTITRQLFNFNLCFNIEDIVSYQVSKLLYGQQFSIEIVVGDDNINEYQIVDFYNNYEDVSRTLCKFIDFKNEETDIEKNIYDYLNDNIYIEYANKNKFSPSIIHWSLYDNPDYIFNVYGGFNGYSKDGDEYIEHDGLYEDTPDIIQSKYSKKLNNINWVNVIKINNLSEFNNIYNYYSDTKHKYSTNFNTKWVKNIKYSQNFDVNVVSLYVENNYIFNLITRAVKSQLEMGLLYYIPTGIGEDNIIMFISNNLNMLTFRHIQESLNKYDKEIDSYSHKMLNGLKTVMNSAIDIPVVIFNKSLYIKNTDGPSLSVKEVEYDKNDNYYGYLLRYDGKIKPCFISGENSNNLLYHKELLNNEEYKESTFSKFANSKYPPLYKSINYYSINNCRYSYNTPDNIANIIGLNTTEHKWFNNSIFIFLIPEINMVINSKIDNSGNYIKLEQLIKSELKYIYNTDNNIDYIYELYNISSSYDYTSVDNINNYTYKVKLNLK